MGAYEQKSNGYVDPTDPVAKEGIQRMENFYQRAYTPNSAFWSQAYIDKRFKAGDQSFNALIYGDNNYFNSRRFFFNLIRKHINMVGGYQRRNRKSTVALARLGDESDKLSDQYTQCIKYSEEYDGFHEEFSQSFEGGLDVGINLLHMYLDYTQDPINGDIMTQSLAYNNFLIDPYFRRQDLSDCNGIWVRKWVTKERAKRLIPKRDKEIDKMVPKGIKDGKFSLQAELLSSDLSNLMTYDEFHYLDTRKAKMIIDPKSGESVEWREDPDDEGDEINQVLAQQPWLKVKNVDVPTVKLQIVLNGRCMYNGPNLLNIDRYPFVPNLCYYEPDMQSYAWRCQGMVRNMRDAQFLFNRRKILELKLLESQADSGWIYPTDVIVDEKAFRQTKSGILVPLKAGKDPSQIKRIDAPVIPESTIQLSKQLSEDITAISGVTEELLGSANDDKAGILSMLRQSAGLTTLNGILDRADYAQRLYGQIRLEAIRNNYSKGKIKAILGEEPHPEFFTATSQRYKVQVEQGNYSTTQRNTELQQLMYFKENLGMPISNKSIMRVAQLTNKDKVEEEMQQEQQQQAQQQQEQMQLEQRKVDAQIMLDYAKTRSDLAKEKDLLAQSQERIAKVEEIHASAEHKQTQTELDLVKTMMDLEDQQLEQIQRALEFTKQQKQPQQQEAVL